MNSQRSRRSLAAAVWTRVVRVYQQVDKRSEQSFQGLGLNTAWFDVLARVRAREGLSQNELAQALLVTKGNISQLVSKLCTEGLVERRAEGRSQRLHLTPRGRALADQAVPRQEALLEQSLAVLAPSEQRQLSQLLRKWERA